MTMQLPLIKDGLVVNVVELDPGTVCVDKGTHKRMGLEENTAYAGRAREWRAELDARQAAIADAEQQLLAAATAAAVVKNAARKASGDAAATLDRVLVAEAEVDAWVAKVAQMRMAAGPEKPAMVRAARWICPEGFYVGPAGGNIGDTWDGRAYTPPVGKTALGD